MGLAHEGRGAEDAVREADLPAISHKTWQAEILTFCWVAPFLPL